MSAVITRSETMNFRVAPAKKELIQSAADALGKTATDFMVETLCDRAHEVLADRTQFQLSADSFGIFSQLLDQPVNASVLRLLAKKSPWE